MKSQRSQVIALVALLVIWAISWRMVRNPTPPPSVIKTAAAKAAPQDSPLKARFHRVRGEMDTLYHYRIKPAPFDNKTNPFRIAGVVATHDADEGDQSQSAQDAAKMAAAPVPQIALLPSEMGEALLKHAIEATRIGGVVTMNDTTELTVDGQLHKEGDVFTTKVKARLVLIRIKHLSTTSVTLALDDPDAGNAEMKIHLK